MAESAATPKPIVAQRAAKLRFVPRALLVMVLLSLAVRLALWGWVVTWNVPPLYDEAAYLERASAWSEVWRALAVFKSPSPSVLDGAYGEGRWPPLHPMVLGLAMATGGGTAVARLVGVVFSALTTGVLFLLAGRIADSRVAVATALIHIFSPAFLAYSHSLWSENLAILLALCGVLLGLECDRRLRFNEAARRPRSVLVLGFSSGLFLAAAALTRVALLPWIVVVPLWLAIGSVPWRKVAVCRKAAVGRGLLALLCLAVAILVTLPWQAALAQREGRWSGLSTASGYNFALGNHADVPAGYGSSWGHETSKEQLHQQLRTRAEEAGVPWWQVASAAAWQEIEERPLAALLRIPLRVWLLWAPDALPARHLVNAVYPPLSPSLTILCLLTIVAFHVALLALLVAGSIAGDLPRRHLGLLLALALSGLVPPALSVATTRLHLPLEAVLLPVAGGVLARGLGRSRRILAVAVAGLTALLSLAALPRVIELYWIPSSFEVPWLEPAARTFGWSVDYSDRLAFRRSVPGDLEVHVVSAGARLAPQPWLASGEEPLWRAWPPTLPSLEIDVFSDGREAVEIEVREPDTDRAVGPVVARLRPVRRAEWRTWVKARRPDQTSAASIEVSWLGGGRSPH